MATAKIKTFEAACKVLKLDPEKVVPKVSAFPKEHQKALVAIAKLVIIAQALNGSWKPDWNDSDQYKYYPWFDMEKDKNNPGGFRLDYVDYNYNYFDVGSRLCFRSRDLANYAGTQFIDLYKDFMVL
jgi:hypothetical protein